MSTVHGSARLTNDGKLLTVATYRKVKRKDGDKMMPNVVVYVVEDARPDRAVANPAIRLTKEDGENWVVHKDEWGISCSCPHSTFSKNGELCKHAKACIAVRLMPKPEHFPGAA